MGQWHIFGLYYVAKGISLLATLTSAGREYWAERVQGWHPRLHTVTLFAFSISIPHPIVTPPSVPTHQSP